MLGHPLLWLLNVNPTLQKLQLPAQAEENSSVLTRACSCPRTTQAQGRSIPHLCSQGGSSLGEPLGCADGPNGALCHSWPPSAGQLCQELAGNSSPRCRQGGARGISEGNASRHLQRADTFTHSDCKGGAGALGMWQRSFSHPPSMLGPPKIST